MSFYKNLLLYLIITSGILMSACKKYLDVEPKESISSNNVISNRASAENALRGIYNALASSNPNTNGTLPVTPTNPVNYSYYGGAAFTAIGYLNGDNVQYTGSQTQIQDLTLHVVKSDNATITNTWIGIYTTINRANEVIAHVPVVNDPTFPVALKNQFVGEAYFIRALAYFDLARTFGGVPIITEPTIDATQNREIARSSLEATYQRVIQDLNIADSLLSNIVPAAGDLRFRANIKTVYALKARYYLYQSNWELAEQYASKVISDANYKLVTPYSAFFANNARGTTESVFELFYNGTTEINPHFSSWQLPNNGGTRQWAPSPAFIKLDTTVGGGRSALIIQDKTSKLFVGNLYYRKPGADPAFVIRIAELFLIRAEARARQENLSGAAEDLNAIRKRAGLENTSAQTKEEYLLAIENERRLEFAFEADRWFDLVRTGRAKEVLGIKEDFRLLMPIPLREIQNNSLLKQNSGY